MDTNPTNLLRAIHTLVQVNYSKDVEHIGPTSNRINQVGDGLEVYIKDVFCNALDFDNKEDKNSKYEQFLSWQGTKNNPPDLMLRNGDAIEVKKIESYSGDLQLNSSPPRSRLYSNDPMITNETRSVEKWDVKDLLYCIGTVPKQTKQLKSIWFVYGDCFAASRDTYDPLRDNIRQYVEQGVEQIGYSISPSAEIARVNRVDPLSITELRVRGMWLLKHPAKVFEYIKKVNTKSLFSMNAIMTSGKYFSFPEGDRLAIQNYSENDNRLYIKCVEIYNPNNPTILDPAVLISYEI